MIRTCVIVILLATLSACSAVGVASTVAVGTANVAAGTANLAVGAVGLAL